MKKINLAMRGRCILKSVVMGITLAALTGSLPANQVDSEVMAMPLELALPVDSSGEPDRTALSDHKQPRVAATVSGTVRLPDGSPAAKAIIISEYGGKAVSDENGEFEITFEMPVPQEGSSREVGLTAAATQQGVNYLATSLVHSVSTEENRAGVIMTLNADSACEPKWIPTFGESNGIQDWELSMPVYVRALAVFDDGSGDGPMLYAGLAGSSSSEFNGLARWDGEQWTPAGGQGLWWWQFGGIPAYGVYSMTVFDDGSGEALYVGGLFTEVDGIDDFTCCLARWDGEQWSEVGGGVNNTVAELKVIDDGWSDGPSLYVGGIFTEVGVSTDSPIEADRIARWDGTTWHTLAEGLDSWVFSIQMYDDGFGDGPALYVGGQFTTAGEIEAHHIARWDGASWSSVGGGVNGDVWALEVFDDGSGLGSALYAGGTFTQTAIETEDPIDAGRIARWDGEVWSNVGQGSPEGDPPSANNTVHSLYVTDLGAGPVLFAGGRFTSIDGISVGRIAQWNGSSWSSPAGGVSGSVPNQTLLFTLLLLDDKTLNPADEPALVVGGRFNEAGGETARNVSTWSGSEWTHFLTGSDQQLNGQVHDLTVFDDGQGGGPALYAGGTFTMAGDVEVNRIARWDGESWSSLGSGMDNQVRSLAVLDLKQGDGPQLFATGRFTTAGGVAANRIARWDGEQWHPLGSGLGSPQVPPSLITSMPMTTYDDGQGGGLQLYVGGSFGWAGGQEVSGVARWDGAQWSPVGAGLQTLDFPFTFVEDLVVFDDGTGPALYAGGYGFFGSAEKSDPTGVARWNGLEWTAVGEELSTWVRALKAFDDGSGVKLYAGFDGMAGDGPSLVARWDGSAWSQVGDSFPPVGGNTVSSLEIFDDGSGAGPQLYASSSKNVVKWDGKEWSLITTPAFPGNFDGPGLAVQILQAFTNPVDGVQSLYAGGTFTTSPALAQDTDQYIAQYRGCPVPSGIPGDLNGDGVVNVFDLLLLLEAWGMCADSGDCPADLNGDGQVNVFDLLILLESWG